MSNNNLFETNATVDVVGAIYNVEASDLAGFVEDYLKSKGLKGVVKVIFNVGQRDKLSGYAFIDQNSEAITGRNVSGKVSAKIRNKMDGTSDIKFTNEAYETLVTVCGDRIDSGVSGKGTNCNCYVRLNVFMCLALYLRANPRQHQIIIYETARISDNHQVVTVIKRNRLGGRSNDERTDAYMRYVENMDSRRGN